MEDEALIAASEALTLEKYGYKTITVYTGEKAVQAVNETPDIDLILMDINLGNGMDGTKAAEIILGKYAIPVIFLSSHTEREIVEKTEGITSYGYIVKDSGETVLIASIKMAFRLFYAKQKEIEKEIALRKSEEQLKAFFSYIPALVLLKDDELRIIYANEKYKSLFPFDSWKGKKPEEVYPEDVASHMRSKDSEALEKGYVDYEEDWTDVKGIRRTFHTEKFKIAMPDNKPLLGAIITDITERKQADQKLRESEERLSSFMDSAADSFFILDSNLNFIEINKRGAELIGKKKEDIIGKNITDIIPHVKESGRYQQQFELTRSGKPFVIDHFVPHPIFGNMHFVLNSFKMGDGLGVIAHDITDRKKAEEALRESEEIFGRFMEYSPIYVFFKDENIRSVRLSKNYETMLGKPLVELLGKNMDELFPSKIAKSMVADDIRILNEGKEITVEEKFNGRYYSTIKFPIFIEGKPRYLAGYTIDITERKRSEQMLRESEEKYHTIVDMTKEWIWEMDLNGKYTFSNPSVTEILGYTIEEILETDVARIIHPEDMQEIEVKMPLLIAGRRGWHGWTKRWRHKDGSYRYLESNAGPILNKNGAIVGYRGTDRDITKRKLAEEANRKNLKLLENIINSSRDYIYVKDRQLRTIICNETFAQAVGKRPDDLVGKTDIENGWPPESVKGNPEKGIRGFEQDDLEALNGKIIHNESETATIMGSVRTFDTIKLPLRDDNGELIGVLGISRDITERIKTEESLRESHTSFRQLAENINEVFWLRDAGTGRIIYVSPTYQKIWGRSVESLYETSRSFLDDVHPDDLPKASLARQALREKGEKFDLEYRVMRPDGEVRWVRARTYPVFDENNRLIRYAGIAEDITERKLAEESVQESEERFGTIFEEAYLGIVIASPSFVFQKVNPAFCRMLGYTAEELCLMTFADITHPEHIDQDIENVKKVGRGEIPFYRTEKRYINKKGETLWGYLVVSGIRDKHGALRYYLSMIDNITDRKVAEDKLVAAMHETDILREKAEKAYQEKELLLREVHHRIKNNMSTIISLLSLHSHTMKDPSAVFALEDATSRLRSMGVLYDKLYRSKNYRELSVKDYIPPLVEEIASVYPNRSSVKIETRIEDFVLGEKILSPLGIIVNEIITNAMKYAFTGRDDGLITVSALIQDNHATLSIGDNGNGIPQSVEIESSGGLGFKLVGMLTKQIGGSMKIERRKGTKFILKFDV